MIDETGKRIVEFLENNPDGVITLSSFKNDDGQPLIELHCDPDPMDGYNNAYKSWMSPAAMTAASWNMLAMQFDVAIESVAAKTKTALDKRESPTQN